VLDDEGDDPYILGHAQDITERFHHERKLRDWSTRDPLTGCLNRRFLDDLTQSPPAQQWGCIAVDLDHFKQVNDTHGHQRGDEVLVAMAQFLTEHVRPQDAVVRVGGDEFLLLLRSGDAALTEQVAERIEADRHRAAIEFTLGVAAFGAGVSLQAGLAEADRRLYATRARRRG
jgi:diguanylate cyclase (GGDEF)-like protein